MKVIFLDRDGVINQEVGYLHNSKDFKFIDGTFDACKKFQTLGYKLIIVTNQSGIARGYFNENDYKNLTQWMLGQFYKNSISILDIFYCPHGPESKCDCRKPKPGMINFLIKKFNIDINRSWLIGDRETDIQAARSASVNSMLITDNLDTTNIMTDATLMMPNLHYAEKYLKEFYDNE